MSTPAPNLTLNATSDKPSYTPGELVTVTAEALASTADTVTVSATLAGVTVNAEVGITVEEPAAAATFGISDSLGNSWSQQAGAAPGTVVFTATLPAAAVA